MEGLKKTTVDLSQCSPYPARDFNRPRTMCPGVDSASKKWVPGISPGVKAAGAWGWRPTTLVVPNVKYSGALTYPDPLGHLDGLLWVTFTFTFLPTSHLTIWSRTLHEKKILPCENMFHYRNHNIPLPVPPLRHINPVHTPKYSWKVHFNIILPFKPRSSKWSLSFRFPHQNPICTAPLPKTRYIRRPPLFFIGSSE